MGLELVNVVGGGEFGRTIDIHHLHQMLPSNVNPEYEPEVSPGLRLELPKSNATALLFGSGKYHITGAKSETILEESAGELSEILTNTSTEFDGKYQTEVELRNLVFVGDLEQEIDLRALSQELEGSDFDPGEFPGLQYRRENLVMTIYRSGKFTVTGCKNRQSAVEIANTIHEILSSV